MAPRIRKRPGRDKTARGANQAFISARSITQIGLAQHTLDERGRPATAEDIFRQAQTLPPRGGRRFVASGSEVDSWKRKFRGRR